MPKALVIRAPGTNCDSEMCRAFELAGAKVDLGVLYKRFEDHFAVRSRFLGTSIGEVVVAGAVPLCLAHGVATWDLPGGAVVGYQYVPGSLELFTEADYTQARSALNARALGELPWL